MAGLVGKYITQKSVSEGLVHNPSQWKGLHGYHQLVDGEEVSGPWVDRTKLYWSLQKRKKVTEADVTSSIARHRIKSLQRALLIPPDIARGLVI